MEHSKNYDKVKGFYNRKLWDLTRVRNAVVKGWITEEEFADFIGSVVDDDRGTRSVEDGSVNSLLGNEIVPVHGKVVKDGSIGK